MADDNVTQYGQVPFDSGHQTMAQAYRSEVVLLREIVRRCMVPDYRPWMKHSPCDEAYERAFNEDRGGAAWPVDGDRDGISSGW